jgi:F-type H+-transporting ATPase subunit epsilon
MVDHRPGAKTLRCVVVTPERGLLDEPADYVGLPLFDGQLGVLPGRAPLIGRLGTGVLRLRRAGQERIYYVDGGFVQVRADVVSVLTSRALRPEEINVATANEALQAPISGIPPEEQEKHVVARERARVQLRLAGTRPESAPTPHA